MKKDYSNETGWRKGFHSKREYDLVGAAKTNPMADLSTTEIDIVVNALELAYEHAPTGKRSAIKKVHDKLAA